MQEVPSQSSVCKDRCSAQGERQGAGGGAGEGGGAGGGAGGGVSMMNCVNTAGSCSLSHVIQSDTALPWRQRR